MSGSETHVEIQVPRRSKMTKNRVEEGDYTQVRSIQCLFGGVCEQTYFEVETMCSL